ncbi:YCF48-related protein, partial [Bacteroidota bacterium]
ISCEKDFNSNESNPIDNDTILVNDTVIIVDTALIEFLDGWNITKTNFGFNFYAKDLYFVNSEIGFLVGSYGRIYKTIDAGMSWQELETGASIQLYSVFFLNENIGFVSGQGSYDSGESILLKTNDGGETWQKINYTDFIKITNLQFFNNLDGLSIISTLGENGLKNYYLAQTIDGGITWEFLDLEVGMIYNFFSVDKIVYIIGRNQTILKSKDYGNTWETINTPIPSNESIYNLYFINENTGIIRGYDFYKTNDGGLTWTKVQFPITTFEYAFHFYSEKEGFSTELVYEPNDSLEYGEFKGYRSYQTYDGGETWYKSKLDDSNVFYHPFFPQRDIGFSYFGPEFYIIRRK